MSQAEKGAKVAVLGIGSGGCTIVSSLREIILDVADLFYVHSQAEYLNKLEGNNKIDIGISETRDFGTNGESYLGRKCAENNWSIASKTLHSYDVVFLVAGLGGGTGSGATPYFAKFLKNSNTLVISIISLPFSFEGDRKKRIALSAYQKIKSSSDTIVVVNNDHILNNELVKANSIFEAANHNMSSTIYGLSTLLIRPGLINIDIDDVKDVLVDKSNTSATSIGRAHGEKRASTAAKMALLGIQSLHSSSIFRPKGFIISIIAGLDMEIHEFEEVGEEIRQFAHDDATVVVGTVIDPSMVDDMEVVITVSGIEDNIIVPRFSQAEIFRSITFEPEHIQAGISILSYFGEVLKQKYSDIEAKVRIERRDDTVTLIIESELGVIEKIEKTLDAYGEIVTGSLPSSSLLESKVDIERLEMKLEMSAMEIRHSQKIINLYENDKYATETRVSNLEQQVTTLHKLLGESLKGSNRIATSSLALSRSNTSLMEAHLQNIKELLSKAPSEANSEELIKNINRVADEDSSYLGAVRELFVNSVYGITGNSAYNFLISAINAIPK